MPEKPAMIMKTARVKDSVGEKSQLRDSVYLMPEEREDQDQKCDSTNDFDLMESNQTSLPSSEDDQSMDTPNTFENKMPGLLLEVTAVQDGFERVVTNEDTNDYERKLVAPEVDQQSNTETEQPNVKETKGCFMSCLVFQSPVQALLLCCSPFCKTSFPHTDEADHE
ncbi:hypothetical protein HF521_012634 [Silurus meridionalis]|uniref:Uncharacterized protein n=1 Tax=Silurus meridionalis TaxID=175797 RepID=A0A8T0AD63_SILME|nr:hypothetical protein HF521_012634 [Silurus meridionalis]